MREYKMTMEAYRSEVEEYLQGCFTDELAQKTLFDAMRYSLLAGGKRIRPVLVLEFCHQCGRDYHAALPFAAAIEMVHTYSLIHDDLPCMDNDDYRRGRLTNHKIFGEAMAVLAGDALLTAAFETVSRAEADAKTSVEIVRILSGAAGERGMVGGQVLDLEGENRNLGEEDIYTVHKLKTSKLIEAACCMGVAAGGGSNEQMQAAKTYAEALGMAFQVRDDMLDVLGDAALMGKATNMDANKSTFVHLYGVGACAKIIEQQTQRAIDALSCFSDRDFLTTLAHNLALREY